MKIVVPIVGVLILFFGIFIGLKFYQQYRVIIAIEDSIKALNVDKFVSAIDEGMRLIEKNNNKIYTDLMKKKIVNVIKNSIDKIDFTDDHSLATNFVFEIASRDFQITDISEIVKKKLYTIYADNPSAFDFLGDKKIEISKKMKGLLPNLLK